MVQFVPRTSTAIFPHFELSNEEQQAATTMTAFEAMKYLRSLGFKLGHDEDIDSNEAHLAGIVPGDIKATDDTVYDVNMHIGKGIEDYNATKAAASRIAYLTHAYGSELITGILDQAKQELESALD